jgi:hypothetical protein
VKQSLYGGVYKHWLDINYSSSSANFAVTSRRIIRPEKNLHALFVLKGVSSMQMYSYSVRRITDNIVVSAKADALPVNRCLTCSSRIFAGKPTFHIFISGRQCKNN